MACSPIVSILYLAKAETKSGVTPKNSFGINGIILRTSDVLRLDLNL